MLVLDYILIPYPVDIQTPYVQYTTSMLRYVLYRTAGYQAPGDQVLLL